MLDSNPFVFHGLSPEHFWLMGAFGLLCVTGMLVEAAKQCLAAWRAR
jgi:hypothetical protein